MSRVGRPEDCSIDEQVCIMVVYDKKKSTFFVIERLEQKKTPAKSGCFQLKFNVF